MKNQDNQNDNEKAGISVPDDLASDRPEKRTYEEKENLGLDADGSSESFSEYGDLDHDNDRISGNPDGEDDRNDTNEVEVYSPIMDK